MKGRLMSVTVDFIELDFMRDAIRRFGKNHGIPKPLGKREYWEKSGFYIGRTVVRFYFKKVTILQGSKSNKLMEDMHKLFGKDYEVSYSYIFDMGSDPDEYDLIFTLKR